MDIVGFFKSIGSEIKHIAIHIKAGFLTLFGAEAAEKFGHASLDLLKSALGQIVVSEVQALAGVSTLDGAAKAAQAQGAIIEKAKGLGISVSTSIINLLIELAVQFVKGNLEAVEKQAETTPPIV